MVEDRSSEAPATVREAQLQLEVVVAGATALASEASQAAAAMGKRL